MGDDASQSRPPGRIRSAPIGLVDFVVETGRTSNKRKQPDVAADDADVRADQLLSYVPELMLPSVG